MTNLVLAALFFVVSHVGLSFPGLRDRLVARLGRGPFIALYATLAVVALAWLVLAYRAAPVVMVWPQEPWTRYVPLLVMPFASVLLVTGLFTLHVTVLSDARLPDGTDPAPGILKVTRHPVMWAVALWAAAHIPPNGEAAAIILFTTILALALAGMGILDAKRARTGGAAWHRFAAVTSVLPFAATLAGRNRVRMADIGTAKIAAGLILYFAFLLAHEWVIGMSPFPA